MALKVGHCLVLSCFAAFLRLAHSSESSAGLLGFFNGPSTTAGNVRGAVIRDASTPFESKGTSRESWYRCADYNPLRNGEKNIAEFRCTDGMCISIDNFCNGFPNCRDGSDEANCPKGNADPFDCDVEYQSWSKKWSLQKKAWCCQHDGRGCPPNAPQPYTCDADSQSTWPAKEQIWCCSVKSQGCTAKVVEDAASTTTLTSTSTSTRTSTSTTPTTTTITRTSTTATTSSTLTSSTRTSTSTTTATTITTTTMTTTTTTTTLDSVAATMACSEESVSYLPLDMPGQSPREVGNVSECQALCAFDPECATFSYWLPFRHCHLQNAFATRQENQMGFVAGPPSCASVQSKPRGDVVAKKLLDFAEVRETAESIVGVGKPTPLSLRVVFGGIIVFGVLLAFMTMRLRLRPGGTSYGTVPTQSQGLLLPITISPLAE